MRALRNLVAPALLAAAAFAAAAPAHAVVVERVVAVVGDRPILLSDLRTRARPFLLQIAAKVPPGPQQAAAESQVMKELIQKMVDEELESQAAERAHVNVTSEEVDNALRNIAQMQNLAVPDLVREAARQSGLTEQDYRDEIRRQILEGKMLQLRVKGRVRLTEEDVRGMYEKTVREERKRREYHPAWIVLRILPGSSAEAVAERRALANELIRRVRKGEDFGELAKRYSDDTATRESGGDLGVRAPQGTPQAVAGKRQMLATELENEVMLLDEGQVSEPIDVGGEAIVIVQLLSRQPSRYTGYEAARQEMMQRLQTEILEKAKRKWLDELKGRTHLEVRL